MNVEQLKAMDREIKRIRSAAENLIEQARDFPAVTRNAKRILANVKMLEINLSQPLTLIDDQKVPLNSE